METVIGGFVEDKEHARPEKLQERKNKISPNAQLNGAVLESGTERERQTWKMKSAEAFGFSKRPCRGVLIQTRGRLCCVPDCGPRSWFFSSVFHPVVSALDESADYIFHRR